MEANTPSQSLLTTEPYLRSRSPLFHYMTKAPEMTQEDVSPATKPQTKVSSEENSEWIATAVIILVLCIFAFFNFTNPDLFEETRVSGRKGYLKLILVFWGWPLGTVSLILAAYFGFSAFSKNNND